MPVKPSIHAPDTLVVAAAVAQDGGTPVALVLHAGRCVPEMPFQSFPGLLTEAHGLLPVETANVLPGLNGQCGRDLAAEVARRRRAGEGPLDRPALIAAQEGLADAGFDAFPADRIDRLWLTATREISAAMMLLRWTAVLYRDVASAELGSPGTRELSVIAAKHATALVARAEAVLESDAMHARMDRIAEALHRGEPVSAEALTALTADIPRTVGVSDLAWPWLAQRLAVCRSDSAGQPDCPETSPNP